LGENGSEEMNGEMEQNNVDGRMRGRMDGRGGMRRGWGN
jgi:hypothetical protein